MRIVIIGAGAMGCLFGAWLSNVSEVTLVDINHQTVDSINEHGVIIEHMDGRTVTFQVPAIYDTEEYRGRADTVIVFTKSHGTVAAARAVENILAEDGLCITLQNGVGNLERLQEILGKGKVVAGVTAQAGTVVGPGHARHAGAGETVIGALEEGRRKVEAVQGLLSAVGVATRISEDTRGIIWGKLIVNVGINGLAAILRVTNGTLAEVPACRELMASAVEEAVQVAAAMGIALPFEDPLAAVVGVCEQTSANRASMLQDILRKVPTEIDVINQAIVEAGEQLGIPTPTNVFITRVIRALEASSALRINQAL